MTTLDYEDAIAFGCFPVVILCALIAIAQIVSIIFPKLF